MSGIIYKINKLIEAQRLTKQEFADKVGVSRDTVYNWTDDNIKVSTLVRVCEVFKVPISEFVYTPKNLVKEPAANYGKASAIIEELKEKCLEYRNTIKSLNEYIDQLKRKNK